MWKRKQKNKNQRVGIMTKTGLAVLAVNMKGAMSQRIEAAPRS